MRFLFWRALYLVLFYDLLLARDDFPGIHRRVQKYPIRKRLPETTTPGVRAGRDVLPGQALRQNSGQAGATDLSAVVVEELTDTICAALNNACVWYPRRAECLQRSAVLTCLLRRYGLPAQMVIGTQKLPFRAHAWVELNGRVVNDKQDMPQLYAEIARC
jgi:hypothetical protein